MKYQYFSKWQNKWINFVDSLNNPRIPTQGELKELEKYFYKIRIIEE